MQNRPEWQLRLVDGVHGGKAVRFLGPNQHTLVEIPASVLRDASFLLLAYETEALETGESSVPLAGPT